MSKPAKPATHHDSFTLDRTYAASPARVFDAWSNPAAKARWFSGPGEWTSTPHRLDFRIGGRETVAGGPPGGPVHRYDATYHDIVEDRRIVTAYDMYLDDTRISVSLATVELTPAGTGTRLVYTEHGVYLDGYDDAGSRERGTHELLDKLDAALRA
jgi:uncharacterized protein YndB with AHSA1/START domain